MNWIGSGFIQIINYSSSAQGVEEQNSIITELSANVLTEDSSDILIET